MSSVYTSKIDTLLPTAVLTALAEACGFHIAYDRSPGVDEWTISHKHGPINVQHVGTRRDICAFLSGYADMQLLTTTMLNDLDNTHRRAIVEMRERLAR